MHPEGPADPLSQFQLKTFDDPLGRRIIETHIWAVREGLRGASAYELFDGYCQRLVVNGAPLWRAHAAMETLHPQWNGYGYTWRRDLNAIQPEQYAHGSLDASEWLSSPLFDLIRRARERRSQPANAPAAGSRPGTARFPGARGVLRRRRDGLLRANSIEFGEDGDRSQGSGVVYSFTTDRRGGFSDDDATLLQATLPALSLAMKAHAGHVIASGLLGTYLGEDAGRRVHAGAVERGSVDSLRAVALVRRHPRLHSDQRRRAGLRHRRPAQRRLRDTDRRAAPARRPSA